jgi:hypothetical protein
MKLIVSIFAVSFLAGCSTLNPFNLDPSKDSFAGSGAILANNQVTELDLCELLEQFDLRASGADVAKTTRGVLQDRQPVLTEVCKFKNTATGLEPNRNNMVSYLMAISDQKCGTYKNNILRSKAEFSTVMGITSTLFAGTSAVLTHAHTASAFAAGSAAASGSSAVFTQERFSNLAVEVITAGIDQRREEIYADVKAKFPDDISTYPVANALKDALAYHSACSAVTGLEVAKSSIERVDNPGITNFKSVLDNLELKMSIDEKDSNTN